MSFLGDIEQFYNDNKGVIDGAASIVVSAISPTAGAAVAAGLSGLGAAETQTANKYLSKQLAKSLREKESLPEIKKALDHEADLVAKKHHYNRGELQKLVDAFYAQAQKDLATATLHVTQVAAVAATVNAAKAGHPAAKAELAQINAAAAAGSASAQAAKQTAQRTLALEAQKKSALPWIAAAGLGALGLLALA